MDPQQPNQDQPDQPVSPTEQLQPEVAENQPPVDQAPVEPMQPAQPAPVQPQPLQPQPVQPQPMPMQEPSPQKKGKGLKIALIAVGVFLLLCVVGGIFAVLSTVQTAKEADAFVAAIVSEDYTAAYDFFAPELKEAQSFEEMQGGLATMGFGDSCELEIESRSTSTGAGERTLNDIKGNIVCGADTFPTELTFVKTDDGQKLWGYDIQPPNMQ